MKNYNLYNDNEKQTDTFQRKNIKMNKQTKKNLEKPNCISVRTIL